MMEKVPTHNFLTLSATLFATLCLSTFCSIATAQEEQEAPYFDIPAQPLKEALIDFGIQAQLSLVYTNLALDGISSRPVQGTMSHDEALDTLLTATLVSGDITESGAVLLTPTRPAKLVGSYPATNKWERRRADILTTRDDALNTLYDGYPKLKAVVDAAPGYAVFSNVGINLLFVSAGSGSGVAHDNKTDADIFMKMATGGLGLGLGVKDFQAVFIFHTADAFDQFIKNGWDMSGKTDAKMTTGDDKKSAKMASGLGENVSIYRLIETAFTLQASLQGTKYWPYKKLNQALAH